MSSQKNFGNRKLFASQRSMNADRNKQPKYQEGSKGDGMEQFMDKDEQQVWDTASVPRHRIPGKQRMPPYYEPSPIKVPEPRRRRSTSSRRSVSQPRPRLGLSTDRYPSAEAGTGYPSAEAGTGYPCAEAGTSTAICLPTTCSQVPLQEPMCLNDAFVMVVPKSYLPNIDHIPCASAHGNGLPSTEKENGPKTVSFARKPRHDSDTTNHVLGKKVAPLYVPRPNHEQELPGWEAESRSEESDDGYNTPWGRRLTAIRVARVKRDFDEETVSLDPPEGSLPVCGRCGVVVYLAEDRRAAGRHFHSNCFKCFLCSAALDSVNLHERNQEVYCKSCYIRQFGPKGYDYGPGEGALRME